MHVKNILTRSGAVITGLVAPVVVFAASNPLSSGGTAQSQLGAIQTQTGLGNTSLPVMIGKLINAALGFLGILLLVYIIYAGFLWMTAQGEEKQVQKAKDIIKNAIIGLIITVSAYAISSFVITQLATATA